MRIARFDEVEPTKQQRTAFRCGEPSLDRWLVAQARQSMENRDAVTYLLLDDEHDDDDEHGGDEPIAGYFCLSAGSIERASAPEAMGKGAPASIPVVRMGRLAIDDGYQGHGWGSELLREALLRAVKGRELIGARLLLVDAINEPALAFYERFGFTHSPIHPMQVFYDLRVVAASAGIP